ncbi:MAG: hypothetical protein U0414_26495 [Polyangiaceae bacterium]
MAVDLTHLLPDGAELHPSAAAILGEDTELLWAVDSGPMGSDAGRDAVSEFADFRDASPRTGLATILAKIVSDFESAGYPADIASEPAVRRALAEIEDFYQDVYVLDETVIATGLARLLMDGRVDGPAREMLGRAVARQSQPLVLERLYPDRSAQDVRRRALAEVARLFAAAPESAPRTAPRSRKRTKRAPFPWDVGSIFRRSLEGRSIYLHFFAGSREAPTFLVLDCGDELPAELDTVQPKPARDLWKFNVSLPPVEAGESAEAWKARLAQTLEPTGRSVASSRSPVPCRALFWEELDEHLRTNWEW